MKNFLKLTFFAFMMLFSVSTYAQKFGYINTQELLYSMPERDSVEIKLTAFSQELSEQLEAIQVEFNNKLQDLQKNQSTWSESVRQLKERDLQSLQERHGEFQQTAQQDMQKMQTELMTPVVQKAEEAIAKVSQENSLSGVFDISTGALAYYKGEGMVNILPLVQKALGITPTVTE